MSPSLYLCTAFDASLVLLLVAVAVLRKLCSRKWPINVRTARNARKKARVRLMNA